MPACLFSLSQASVSFKVSATSVRLLHHRELKSLHFSAGDMSHYMRVLSFSFHF